VFLFILEVTFAAGPRQVQSYRDALFIAIAPMSLHVFLLIPLLLGHLGIVGNLLAFFLIVNLSGTAWISFSSAGF
jgi:hypothetical protein